MARRRARPALLLAALALLLTAAPEAAHADEVGTPAVTSAQLSGVADTRAVFPVTLAPGVRPSVKPAVLSVARSGLQEEDSFAAVRATWDRAVPGLVLTAPRTTLRRPADYTVVIRLSSTDAKKKAVSQVVTLTLVRPPTTLELPGVLTVVHTRTSRLPTWLSPRLTDATPDQSPPLTVTAPRDTRLSCVEVHESGAERGRVTLDQPRVCAPDLGSGASTLTIPYALGDNVPLGPTSQTIAVEADELAAPASVTVNATSRRSAGWLTILVAVGLLAGVLIRVVLVDLALRQDQRRRRLDLDEQIADLRDRSPAASYQNALNHASSLVPRRRLRATEFDKKLDEATAAATTALDDLNTALADRVIRLDALRALLAGPWPDAGLPDTEAAVAADPKRPAPDGQQLDAARRDLQGDVDQAASAVAASDVDAAATHLEAAEGALAALDRTTRSAVQVATNQAPGLLEAVDGKRTEPRLKVIREEGTRLKKLAPGQPLAEPGVPQAIAEIDQLRGRLLTARWSQGRVVEAAADLADALAATATILEAKGVDAPEVEQVRTTVDQLREAPWPALATGLISAIGAVEAAFAHQAVDPRVGRLVTRGWFESAAVALPDADEVLSDEDRADVPGLDREDRGAEDPPSIPAASAVPATPVPRHLAAGLDHRRAQVRAAGFGLGVLRFVVLLPLLVLLGWFLFAEDWIGNAKNMLAAFTWAFGIDLTTAGVTAALAAGRPAAAKA